MNKFKKLDHFISRKSCKASPKKGNFSINIILGITNSVQYLVNI